jgi:signal peptidase II
MTMMASPYFAGPFTRFGLLVALAACVLDQASKLYLLRVYNIAERSPVHVTPFIDFVLARNTGISYGLFQTQGLLGQWLMLGFKAVAVALLWVWLARAHTRLTSLALGLIIGGAVGNAIDRLTYGWVADFVFFHISTTSWRFEWYVFNLADVAIVAGVAGLLYESVVGDRAAKTP